LSRGSRLKGLVAPWGKLDLGIDQKKLLEYAWIPFRPTF
jgi:hypothetical protein